MSRKSALLMLWALSACINPPDSPPSTSTDGCGGSPPDAGGVAPRCVCPAREQLIPTPVQSVFVTGHPVDLGFEWKTREGCPGQVQVQVEAPGGAQLQPALELGPPTGSSTWSIPGLVRFSPMGAGTYRVTLRVEGAQGEVVRTLEVATDRSDAAVQELPRWCQALHRTARGTLLCDGEVYRGTDHVQTLSPETLLATAGNVVWEVEGRWVRRYEDMGTGGLTLNPTLALDTGRTQPLALHATEQELLVVFTGGYIARYVHTANVGLAASGEATYPYFTYMDSLFQMRRFEDRVLLVASYGTMSAACYYRASGTSLTLLPWAGPSGQQWNKCQSLAGMAIGMGEDGLWTRDAPYLSSSPERLWLYQLRGSTLEVSTFWDLPSLLGASAGQPASVTTDARVLQSQRWFLPRLGEHGLVLERYEPTDGFELRAAHGELVYEISRGTPALTRIFTR